MKNDEPKEIKMSATIRIEDEFTESCLPLTMKLADTNRELVEPYFILNGPTWAFHDKLLVWLFPSFHKDITKYYRGNGVTMANMINPQAVAHIDEVSYTKLLAKIRAIKGAKTRSSRFRRPRSLSAILGFTIVRRKQTE